METLDTILSGHPTSKVIWTAAAIAGYFISILLFSRVVLKRKSTHSFDRSRALVINKTIRFTLLLILLVVLGLVWGLSFRGLSVYLASIFTVIGVALFATWSILSNVTASVILFFFFPFRIGSRVKILDGDNSVEGEVVGLSLFSIRIRLEDGSEVYFPNNLAIQRGIVELR